VRRGEARIPNGISFQNEQVAEQRSDRHCVKVRKAFPQVLPLEAHLLEQAQVLGTQVTSAHVVQLALDRQAPQSRAKPNAALVHETPAANTRH
jgi:hypothetical protein